jgi:hypothetical protein
MSSIEEPVVSSVAPAQEAFVPVQEEPATEEENFPGWLELDKDVEKQPLFASQEDLPAWLRDETGEAVAEPTKIEPTRATDWRSAEEIQPEPPEPQPVAEELPAPQQPQPEPVKTIEEKPKPAKKPASKPVLVSEPYKEPVTRKGTGMLVMPLDPILASARNELSRGNIPGALEMYAKLINLRPA